MTRLQEEDGEQKHQRRDVDGAEIGDEAADRGEGRLGQPVREIADRVDEAVARVDHVKGVEPAHHHRQDDHPHIEPEDRVDDLENRTDDDVHDGADSLQQPGPATLAGAVPGCKLAPVAPGIPLTPALSPSGRGRVVAPTLPYLLPSRLREGPGEGGRMLDIGARGSTLSAPSVDGAVAQLGERDVRNVEVRGSTPLGSTILQAEELP